MNGFEMLREIKKIDQFKDIPFIIVTAAGNKESIIQGVQSGVTNYIVKPFLPETLEAKIQSCFQSAKKQC